MISLQSSPVSVVRPIAVPGRVRGSWAISGLAGVSGSGNETVYTPYGYLVGNLPANTGVFSIPGVELYTESGGVVSSHAELWRDTGTGTGTGEISEHDVGSLSASATAISGTGYTTFGLGTAVGLQTGSEGTFYSDWTTVGGAGISGVSFGIIQAATAMGGTYPVPSGTYYFGGTLDLELGNSGSGVISTINLRTYTGNITKDPFSGRGPASASITDPVGSNFLVPAHAGNIYQARLKFTVTSFNGDYVSASYTAQYLAFY